MTRRLYCTTCGLLIGRQLRCPACGSENEFLDFGPPPPICEFPDAPDGHWERHFSRSAVEDPTADTASALSTDTDPEPEPVAAESDGSAAEAAQPTASREEAVAAREGSSRFPSTEFLHIDPDTDEFERTVLLEELAGQPRTVARLERVSRPDSGQTWDLPLGATTLGTKGTDIELDRRSDPAVSRRHARIEVRQSAKGLAVTISDLRSSNGTYVNGRRVRTPTPLTDGAEVRLGNVEFIFRLVRIAPGAASEARVTALLSDPLLPPRVHLDGSVKGFPVLAVLERLNGPDAGKTWALRRGSTTVGTEDADITFDPRVDAATSRRHARIDVELDGTRGVVGYVVDLFSSNGTFIGEQRLESGERTPVLDGDVIRVGSVDLRFVVKNLSKERQVTLTHEGPKGKARRSPKSAGGAAEKPPEKGKRPEKRPGESPPDGPPGKPGPLPRQDRPRPFY